MAVKYMQFNQTGMTRFSLYQPGQQALNIADMNSPGNKGSNKENGDSEHWILKRKLPPL